MCALVNSWLTGLPKAPELQTERLILRPVTSGDAQFIQEALNDEHVSNDLSYTPHPYTIEMAEIWVKNVSFGMDRNNCCYWTVIEKSTGDFVGSLGTSLFVEQDNAELHYWIAYPKWGQGFCTEASKRVITNIFEERNMHRLHVTHRENNKGSKNVILKCGFTQEGILREELKRLGKYENVIYYGLLREEYFKLKETGIYNV